MSRVLDVVGGKWRMNILWGINKHKKVRFNQLRREVEGITTISLTRGLDVLIEKQLVEKYDFESMPLHTEYELTEKGKSLMPILKGLESMGKRIVAINLSLFLSLPSRHLDSHFNHLSPKAFL